MDTEQLAAWLAAYKYSWEAQDADAFVKLFTADCQYADRPYAEPVQGKDFHAFWTALAQRQRDNLIEFEVLEALPVNRGMAVWKAQYVIPSTGEQKEGSGVFLLHFSSDGRCSNLREWQHWRVIASLTTP